MIKKRKSMMIKEPFIRIPVDFQSLNDLKDLVNDYELVVRLSEALKNYQRNYIDSHFMTMEEVLEYIPEQTHADYVVKIKDEKFDKHWRGNAKTLSLKDLLKIAESKERIFLVNTIDKIVDVAYWAESGNKKGYPRSVKYTNKIDFTLNEDKMLCVMPHYELAASQPIGGCKIWPAGYLSGETWNDYTIHGYDIYHFCTKTNQYFGYQGFKQDPTRPWIKKTSRY